MRKIILLVLFAIILTACKQHKTSDTNALDLIKEHYAFSNELTKLSIEYKSVRVNPYQSFDYRKPDSLRTTKLIELDEERKQFYAYSDSLYPGGFNFTFREFQNDSLSVLFDPNGVIYGKKVLDQGPKSISHMISEVDSLLDFKMASKLFSSDTDTINKTTVEDGRVTITQINKKQEMTEYIFSLNPIQLISVESKSSKNKLVFSEHQKSNNIPYARKINHFNNGELQSEKRISHVKKIESISSEKLRIPDGYSDIVKSEKKELKSYQIANNLYLITPIAGDRNVLFKVNNNDISIFGAPIADFFSNKVMELIEGEFPDKKIKEVYITHFHNDHIGGLTAYAKKNILIIADEFSIQAIKEYPRFKEDINDFRFKAIEHKEIINGVQYFIPGNSHSLGQSFAYFVDSEIVYEADFLEIPADNTIPTQIPEVSLGFIEYIRNENLSIKRIVGHHRNDNITLEVMNEYYKNNQKE